MRLVADDFMGASSSSDDAEEAREYFRFSPHANEAEEEDVERELRELQPTSKRRSGAAAKEFMHSNSSSELW